MPISVSISGSDLIFDASQPWQQADDELAVQWSKAIVVHNKADLASPPANARPGIIISAVHGAGIDELLRVMADCLVPDPLPSGAPVPFSSSQQQAIRNALELLETRDHIRATRLLRTACRSRSNRHFPLP